MYRILAVKYYVEWFDRLKGGLVIRLLDNIWYYASKLNLETEWTYYKPKRKAYEIRKQLAYKYFGYINGNNVYFNFKCMYLTINDEES